MQFVRLASAFAALLLASATVLAQGAKLTDPQIAHIAYTADQIDIEAAQQALQKSNNKDVIAFAQDMERDHIPSASNPQLKDLLSTGLKIFQGHEQHAEHVAAEFK
jgi:putative membrane protein